MKKKKKALSGEINSQIDLFEDYLMKYRYEGKKVMASSSFQSHSIPMLHMMIQIDPDIPVVFLQTGFHFPETLAYRDKVVSLLGCRLIEGSSSISKSQQRDESGRLYFAVDPDHCCFLNKTLPMEPLLAEYDVWISGVRRDQNTNRKNFSIEAEGAFNTTRFHPMLEWSNKMIFEYSRAFDLPKHPLESMGYFSVGCEPCTQKFDIEEGRDGRWNGLKKTECGLHTELIK